MNLQKNAGRGSMKMAYSRGYKVGVYQWCDSKVVNCVSSYLDFGVTKVQ